MRQTPDSDATQLTYQKVARLSVCDAVQWGRQHPQGKKGPAGLKRSGPSSSETAQCRAAWCLANIAHHRSLTSYHHVCRLWIWRLQTLTARQTPPQAEKVQLTSNGAGGVHRNPKRPVSAHEVRGPDIPRAAFYYPGMTQNLPTHAGEQGEAQQNVLLSYLLSHEDTNHYQSQENSMRKRPLSGTNGESEK